MFDQDKIEVYEDVLHRIQSLRDVTMDSDGLNELLDKICNWSYAHRMGDGMLSDAQRNELIETSFWRLSEKDS